MKKNLSPLKVCLLLAGSAALVSSCQDYEPFSEQQVQDVAYNREFVKQFGEIDPNQNWDLFGQLARHIGPVTRTGAEQRPSVSKISGTYVITSQENKEYAKMLPEDGSGNQNSYENTNLGRVTQNFITTARSFTFSLVQHWSNHTDEIGIYWYASNPQANLLC